MNGTVTPHPVTACTATNLLYITKLCNSNDNDSPLDAVHTTTEDSLPPAQKPTTIPCSQPAESCPHPSTLFFKVNFNIILSFTLRSSRVVC